MSSKPKRVPTHEENTATYLALIRLFTQYPDEPLTSSEIHTLLNGQIPLNRGDGVVRMLPIPLDRLRARLTFLTNLNAAVARPRSGSSLAHTNKEVEAFVQGGAFYRTGDSPRAATYIYDTAARWFWDPRIGEARLWNNVLPHNALANLIDIAKRGELAQARRKSGTKLVLRYDPVSTLPEGTPLPEVDNTYPAPAEEPQEAAQEPQQGELPFTQPTVLATQDGPLAQQEAPTPVVVHENALPSHPGVEVLSNDGVPGGTLVVKLDGQVIVATIKAVA